MESLIEEIHKIKKEINDIQFHLSNLEKELFELQQLPQVFDGEPEEIVTSAKAIARAAATREPEIAGVELAITALKSQLEQRHLRLKNLEKRHHLDVLVARSKESQKAFDEMLSNRGQIEELAREQLEARRFPEQRQIETHMAQAMREIQAGANIAKLTPAAR